MLERADRFWSFGIPFVAGMALGLLLLVALRSAGLRWTWALLGAPFAWLLWLISWQAGLCCGVASAVAAGGGLYWHLKDTERGGEEARAVREAVGPYHAARAWLARRQVNEQRVQLARRDALGRSHDDRLALGRTRKGSVCHVPIGPSDRNSILRKSFRPG